MNLKIFNVLKYLYKWKIRIIAAVMLAVFLADSYADRIQTYSAQTLIKFNDVSVSNGTFPDGKPFSPNDITSPKVIQRALDDLKISKTVDNIRSHMSVSAIVPDSVAEIRKAKEKDGEDYEYYPTTYSILYSGSVGQSGSDVRNILDVVVMKYIEYYAEKYASFATVDNVVGDEDIFTYDYIEQADIMNDNINSLLSSLEGYNSCDNSFRSALTGMSFTDLIYEYSHLKSFTIPKLYADIYKGRVAINRRRIIEKYTEQEQQMLLRQKNYTEMSEMTKKQMESFAASSRTVPNAYNGSQNSDIAVIDDIHRTNDYTRVKTTYDTLMEQYTTQLVAANNSRLNAEHYSYVAQIFSGGDSVSGDYAALEEEIKQIIKETIDEMNRLYGIVQLTINDYNDKSASKNISLLTGVRCYDNTSKSLYILVAFVLSSGFMVVLAITAEIIKAYKKEEEAEEAENGEDTDISDDPDSEKPPATEPSETDDTLVKPV